MVGTVASSLAKTLESTSPVHLALRICGTQRDGQIIRLSGEKVTIGDSADCTLRLKAAGVDPLHCTILGNAEGTLIRCASEKTTLNGQSFRNATLAVGDRLTIGPIHLKLVRLGRASPSDLDRHTASPSVWKGDSPFAPGDPVALPPRHGRPFALPAKPLAESTDDSRLREPLDRRAATLDARQDELDAQAADLKEAQAALEAQATQQAAHQQEADLQTDARTSELDALHNRLQSAEAAIEEQQSEWELQRGDLRQAQQAVDEQRSMLDSRLAEWQSDSEQLRQATEQLDEEHRALDVQRAELTSLTRQQHETHTNLEAERQALQTELNRLEAERLDLASLRTDQQSDAAQIADTNNQIEAERQKLDAALHTWNERTEQLERDRETLDSDKADLEARSQACELERQQADEVRAALAQERAELESQQQELQASVAEVAAARETLDTERQHFEQESAEWRSQAEELEEARKQFESERAELESRHRETSLQQQQLVKEQEQRLVEEREQLENERQKLDRTMTDLQAKADDLEQARRDWESHQAETAESERAREEEDTGHDPRLEEQLVKEREQLAAEWGDLETRLSEHQAHAEELTEDRQGLEQERSDLERERSELLAKSDEIEWTRQQLEADRAAWDAESRDRQGTVEPSLDETVDQDASPEALDLNDEQETVEAPACENPNQELMERLHRMAKGADAEPHDADDSTEGLADPEKETHGQTAGSANPEPQEQAPSTEEDKPHGSTGDESIDDYMARLLHRVSGGSDAEQEASEEADPAPEVAVVPSTQQNEMLTEIVPKHGDLEPTCDIAAMRELANYSAKSAIDKSQHTRNLTAAIGKIVVATVCVVLGVTILVISDRSTQLGFLSGAVALIAAVLWGFQALVLWMRTRNSTATVSTADAEAKAEAEAAAEEEEAYLSEKDWSEMLGNEPSPMADSDGDAEPTEVDEAICS